MPGSIRIPDFQLLTLESSASWGVQFKDGRVSIAFTSAYGPFLDTTMTVEQADELATKLRKVVSDARAASE